MLRSVCSFDKKNYFQNIFILLSKFVAACMIFFVFVCKRKIISNLRKKWLCFLIYFINFSYIFVIKCCLMNIISELQYFNSAYDFFLISIHFHDLFIIIFMFLCLSCSADCFIYFQCSSRIEIASCWFDKQYCVSYKLLYKLH